MAIHSGLNYVGDLPDDPDTITALQGLLALAAAGLSDAYAQWSEAPERTFSERAFIDRAQVWRRDDPLLAAAAAQLGMTDDQLVQLFVLAKTL